MFVIAAISLATLTVGDAYKASSLPRLSTRLFANDMSTAKIPPAPPGYK